MTSPVRFAAALNYLRCAVEREMALCARRAPLIRADELEALGRLAFGEEHEGDTLQAAMDTVAQRAAVAAERPHGEVRSADVAVDLELDRLLLENGLHGDLLRPLRGYASSLAQAIVKREAKVNETRAAEDTPAVYRGVWKEGGEYQRGSMVTRNGTLWYAEADRLTGQPGNSSGWKMMHKTMDKKERFYP